VCSACFTTLVLVAAGVTSASGPTALVLKNLRGKTDTNNVGRTTQIERNKVRLRQRREKSVALKCN
jgi:hypothetical protein